MSKDQHMCVGLFYYGFEPVFLVEKNKKTTSYAGGCQGFELPFLFPVIIKLFRLDKGGKRNG
ncbi:hypothetical protein U0700_10610 [Streptococcus suis]|uniref:hypothetical protein n=1 Tax=Streptococcus suis TaxID=1307 RepID=UPI002E103564|nr:hypothetical protein U0700_10610 [Streptococcus suis]